MKPRSKLAVFSFLLIVVAAVSSFSVISQAIATPSSTYNFTLQANGQAYDSTSHTWLNVALSVTGTADGKLKMEISLFAKGGSAGIWTIGTFYVTRGFGEIVNPCHYIALFLMLNTDKYGAGKSGLWCLSGRTEKLNGKTLNIDLSSGYIVIPGSGRVLKNLRLEGTITPVQ